ncbi:MAG TPA: hypothetical protein VF516_10095 [Kofleriaceae bacterium]
MTRGRQLAASAAVASVAALWGACGNTTNTGVIELNLDRPVDVSFACYGKMRQTNGRPGPGMLPDPIIKTAMPTEVCQALSPPLSTDPVVPVVGQETLGTKDNPAPDNPNPVWYGFILQSASGTVALTTWPVTPADSMFASGSLPQQISDTPTSKFQVLDADPLTPGKNAISIGEDPVAIITDKTGCFEVTANAGSCDLSELDITSTLANIVDHSTVRPRIDRVTVTGPDGTPILAKPSAMIVEPFLDVSPGTDKVGNACPKAATSQVYIAYPSCHLVAEVRLAAGADGKATAQVIGGIYFDPSDPSGTASVLTDQTLPAKIQSCPTECAPPRGMPVVTAKDGVRPVALDHKLDTRTDRDVFGTNGVKPDITSKLAIGADIRGAPLAAPLTVVDLDLTTFAPRSGSVLQIPLEANRGPVGISALALSPQIGMGSNTGGGKVNDEADDQAQYVYAVATDGTVRVADVLKLKRECDTQIDGRFVRSTSATTLECPPLGQPNLPRRPGAQGPGIELPGGDVANSVTIVKGLAAPPPVIGQDGKPTANLVGAQPTLLLGYFAFITASSGTVFVANVNDDYVSHNITPTKDHALATSPVLVMPHQLRDAVSDREDPPTDCTTTDGKGGAFAGGPRLTAPPVQQAVAATLFTDLNLQLPRLQQVQCDVNSDVAVTPLDFGAPEIRSSASDGPAPSRDLAYPDLKSVVDLKNWTPQEGVALENWKLTYEGTLELDSTLNSINGPSLHFGQTFVDGTGMFIADASRPFCSMGVEPGDIVEFQGCNPANIDTDCPSGYTCYVHPLSTVGVGACFLKSEAPRLQDACRDFLSSIRRYTVGTDASGGTAPGKLVLWQRKHELSTTPVDGCVSDDQCDDLARAAVVLNQGADPFAEAAPGTPVTQRPTHWSCMADPLRKPINTDPARNKRCVQVCDLMPPDPNKPHPVCANGMICAPDPTSVTGGVCMEGVEPPQACLNGPQRYVVRAGEAFTVVGDHSGFVHPIIVSPDGSRCMRDPNLAKDPLSIGRIPLTAPPCGPPPTDPLGVLNYPLTGRLDSATFEPNPCSLSVPQFETTPSYPSSCLDGHPLACPGPDGKLPLPDQQQPPPCSDGQGPLCSDNQPPPRYGTCRGPAQPAKPGQRANFPAIKFRNRSLTLTIVDPYREARQTCLGRDPVDSQTQMPIPTNIPLVVPGYQVTFAVKAGFTPLTVALVGQVSPVKVVRGPSESIWVIDDGDFLATTFVDVSTRGRVFRIESVPPATTDGSTTVIVNTLQ